MFQNIKLAYDRFVKYPIKGFVYGLIKDHLDHKLSHFVCKTELHNDIHAVSNEAMAIAVSAKITPKSFAKNLNDRNKLVEFATKAFEALNEKPNSKQAEKKIKIEKDPIEKKTVAKKAASKK